VGRGVVRLGQIGYIFKRVAFAIVGGLFGWAAITYDLGKAGGLDDALRTVNRAPFGAGPVTLNGARPGLLRHLLLCLGQAPEGPHRHRQTAASPTLRMPERWALTRHDKLGE